MFKEYDKTIKTCEIYEKNGLKMIPVAYKSKRPLISEWTSKAFSSARDIDKYIKDKGLESGMNVGVLCGKESNLVVIDTDINKKDQHNGIISLREKEKELGELPTTVTVQTTRNGTQFWFKYPKGVDKITSTVSKLKDVDIRADGSFVVAVPSNGVEKHYMWILSPEDVDFAELPQKWVNFLANNTKNKVEDKINNICMQHGFALPNAIPESTRNTTMFKSACSMIGKRIVPEEVMQKLSEYNQQYCVPPLSDEELKVIYDSALKTNGHVYNEEPNFKPLQAFEVVDSGNTQETKKSAPKWLIIGKEGEISVNEPKFVEEFINDHQLYYINEHFYTQYGQKEDRYYSHEVQNMVSPFTTRNLAALVQRLINAMKNQAFFIAPKPDPNLIHLQNTTLKVALDGLHEVESQFTFNRLSVDYKPSARNEKWEKYIRDLLEEEDIPTLQEYMGYCLIPSTRGQKSLFITGNGGEGKSGISYIIQKIFDNSSYFADFQDIEKNDFLVANFENKLVFVDDDMKLEKLDDTSKFKKLVTSMGKMSVNQKGVQQYEIEPYIRFICIGNGMISSNYDKTDGFYSRLLWLKVKPVKKRDTDGDNVFLYYELAEDLSGILNWCLEGLLRLIRNKFKFTISEKSKQLVDDLKEESTNIIEFMNNHNKVGYATTGRCSTKDLYKCYYDWVKSNYDNSKPYGERFFSSYLKANAATFNIEESRTIKKDNQYVRGFLGIYLKENY